MILICRRDYWNSEKVQDFICKYYNSLRHLWSVLVASSGDPIMREALLLRGLKVVLGDICIYYSPHGVDTIWKAVTSWPVFTFRLIRLHLCKQAPYFHQIHLEFYVTTQMWHTSSALVLINGFSHLTNGRENLSKSILLWSVHNNKRECVIKSASFSWHLSTCQDTEMSILQSSRNPPAIRYEYF